MEPLQLACIHSRALAGARAVPVSVEVHLGNGLPQFQIVGLPDTEVRESRDRVRVALQASGFEYPLRRITVNLAPADLPKESGHFDLPLALGILQASGQLPPAAQWPGGAAEAVGELGLDGALRPVRGALAMAWEAHASGRALILPAASAAEVALFPLLRVGVADSLAQVCAWLRNGPALPSAQAWMQRVQAQPTAAIGSGPAAAEAGRARVRDLGEVRGQASARHALEVAAAGGHSLLFHGPPGCGKTLLAECLEELLPPLSGPEVVAHAIHRSLAGESVDAGNLCRRAFRRPHHTASAHALTGGGSPMRPGEMSLAHRGVLFLDEIPEFSRACIEALREPLETGVVNVARVDRSCSYPAEFQLVCTMNPCPCGLPRLRTMAGAVDGPAAGGVEPAPPSCQCTPLRILHYRARLSMPVLDRIDLWVPVQAEVLSAANEQQPESSADVRVRVARTWQRQLDRQGCANARLGIGETLVQARLGLSERKLWHQLAARHRLSARGAHRLLRVARTLADMGGHDAVGAAQLLQAAAWRTAF